MRSGSLQMRTLRIVRNRLTQVAVARGSIDADAIQELFSLWEKRDTDVEAIATAGRIRKLIQGGKWSAADQERFDRNAPGALSGKVAHYIGRMDKKGRNHF